LIRRNAKGLERKVLMYGGDITTCYGQTVPPSGYTYVQNY